MTPTERAIERLLNTRESLQCWLGSFHENANIRDDVRRYLIRVDKALARLRRGTNRGVMTA